MSWLVDTLVTTGALIALVLVLRRPVARHFGPGMAYALWLLPLLRMLLPTLTVTVPAAPVAEPVFIAGEVVTTTTAAAPSFDPWLALTVLWLGGAMLFLALRLGGYFLLRHRALRGAQLIERRGAVRVIESDAIAVPAAFGVIDQIVALPRGFAEASDPVAYELALAHELEHHAGRDIAVNFAMQPLLALHWFNPLAWAGWRALRRDQEAACDARVLAGRDSAARAAYARLIADFARGPDLALASPMACAVLTEKSIVYRLRSLTMTEPSTTRRLAGRLLIAAGVLALPLTASITYAAQDAPAPPAAPEAPGAPLKMEKKIVIVEKDSGSKDDGKLKTRVVTKDGKTVVFKTDKDLSDDEIDKKVDEAMAGMPDMPDAPGGPGGPGEHRIVIRRMGPEGMAKHMTFDTETIEGKNCKGGEPTEVDESSDADGQRHRIKIKICAREFAKTTAADAIRKARDEVANDKGIPADIRAKVLKQLDEELERNAKQG
ncbi:M56 family metallopeptidase [Novosphingobium aquiterrae]|uniref:M56 family metallopeptidase n=1 Tax=Novosphingobium aquiterrae TaxID=624388 RepID=A0ABV6PEL2_9SPHN